MRALPLIFSPGKCWSTGKTMAMPASLALSTLLTLLNLMVHTLLVLTLLGNGFTAPTAKSDASKSTYIRPGFDLEFETSGRWPLYIRFVQIFEATLSSGSTLYILKHFRWNDATSPPAVPGAVLQRLGTQPHYLPLLSTGPYCLKSICLLYPSGRHQNHHILAEKLTVALQTPHLDL